MLDSERQTAVIRGLRNGSRDSWTTLYDCYSVDVWRYVARLLGPDAAAVADVVQETFLAAARSAKAFDASRGTLGGWLTGIAHHQVSMHWRQAGRAERLRKLAESGASEICRWLDAVEPPAETWERRELADLVRGVLADLPVEYAALLAAKYFDDRSLEQMAENSGSSVEATKSKLARARREFRARFERLSREPEPVDLK